jgi:hypothetical protein
MNWENKLNIMADTLGDSPSEEQQENLLSWVVHHVPQSYWGSVADVFWRYKDFSYDLRERCAEVGL